MRQGGALPGLVFDDERLAQFLRKLFGHQAAHDVGCLVRRISDDHGCWREPCRVPGHGPGMRHLVAVLGLDAEQPRLQPVRH